MAHTSATSNVISVTRQRNYFHSPNGISDDRGEWHYYQNPTLSHYTYFKEPTFVNDTTNRDELFSIGPMKWRYGYHLQISSEFIYLTLLFFLL